MGDTLNDCAMRELKVAQDEIAAAHKALDEIWAPGQFNLTLPERVYALIGLLGIARSKLISTKGGVESLTVIDEETT